jgi:hypothetical protein
VQEEFHEAVIGQGAFAEVRAIADGDCGGIAAALGVRPLTPNVGIGGLVAEL